MGTHHGLTWVPLPCRAWGLSLLPPPGAEAPAVGGHLSQQPLTCLFAGKLSGRGFLLLCV